MKIWLSLLLALSLPLAVFAPAVPSEPPAVSARSALVMGVEGEILFDRNAHEILPMASTTKLMTALVIAENCFMDELVVISPESCGLEGSSMYLRPGERYTVRELLTGLLLVSGNDAAAALACHCAGTEAQFVAMMNARAAELGMVDTHFMNPHGLPAEGHVSTACDLALLMAAFMQKDELVAIAGLRSAELGGQTLINHNKLLWSCSGCLAGKTGYTRAAGRCLVSCAQRGETRLICVTLSAPNDWNDQNRLYDWAFAHYENRLAVDVARRFEIPVLSGRDRTAAVMPAYEVRLLLPKDAVIEEQVYLPFYVFAPVRAGTAAGRLSLSQDGVVLAELPLLFESDIPLS